MATQREIADHLDLGQTAIYDLARRGVFPKAEAGQLDADQCRILYIRHLRAIAAENEETRDLNLTIERTRKTKEEADGLAMKNAELRGDLLSRADVETAIQSAFNLVRSKLMTVSVKDAPTLMQATDIFEIERQLRRLVYRALKELSETDTRDIVEVVQGCQIRK